MDTITLTPDYELLIPRSVGKQLPYLPGQKFLLSIHDQKVELIPCESLESLEGFAEGMNTDIDSMRGREDRV